MRPQQELKLLRKKEMHVAPHHGASNLKEHPMPEQAAIMAAPRC